MRKYFQIFKVTIQEFLTYPNKFFTVTFMNAATAFVFIIIWKAIYQDKTSLLGYTISSIVTYYSVTYMIGYLTISGSAAKLISEGVHQGQLSALLIKPISYPFFIFTQSYAEKIIKCLGLIILVFLLSFFFNSIFLMPPLINFGLFFISVVFASLINFFIYALVGCLAFWVVKIGGLRSILGRLFDIMSGKIFPLDFLPASVLPFTYFLPFRSMHYLPAVIYLNRLTLPQSLSQIGVQILWIIILCFLYLILWKKGMVKYDSVGN